MLKWSVHPDSSIFYFQKKWFFDYKMLIVQYVSSKSKEDIVSGSFLNVVFQCMLLQTWIRLVTRDGVHTHTQRVLMLIKFISLIR